MEESSMHFITAGNANSIIQFKELHFSPNPIVMPGKNSMSGVSSKFNFTKQPIKIYQIYFGWSMCVTYNYHQK